MLSTFLESKFMKVEKTFIKDPDAKLDYGFDWTNWIDGTDTITNTSWTVPTGIINDNTDLQGAIAIIWLSGGTLDDTYNITCKITTANGRIDERTFAITIQNR